jgi:hypothetical protein
MAIRAIVIKSTGLNTKGKMISVFIISSHLMFSLGLEKLLSQEKSLRVLGNETNIERAIEQIKKYQPDVVIVYRDDTHHNSKSLIIEILKANPNTKVIDLNLENNIFFVYQVTQWVTTDLADLIKAIKDKPLWSSQSSSGTPVSASGHPKVGTGDNSRLTKH